MGSVMVTPTPTAGPLMAAITGFRDSKMRSVTRPAAVAMRRDPAVLAVVEGLAAARQVGAGAEAAPRAGDDHGADRVVGVGLVERLESSRIIVPVKAFRCSGRWRVIVADAVGDVEQDLLEGHGRRSRRGAMPFPRACAP